MCFKLNDHLRLRSWPLSSPSPALEAAFKFCFRADTPWRPLGGVLDFYFISRLPLISAKSPGSEAKPEQPPTERGIGHSAGQPQAQSSV